jgi:hypothetical protein
MSKSIPERLEYLEAAIERMGQMERRLEEACKLLGMAPVTTTRKTSYKHHRKAADKAATKNGVPWTDAENAIILEGVKQGRTWPFIAEKLSRTTSATYQQWNLYLRPSASAKVDKKEARA